MFEKLMVPLDGSITSEAALPYAEELAARMRSQIILLHVFESSHSQYEHMHDIYLEQIAENIETQVRILEANPGEKAQLVKRVTLTGHAAEEIVDYAESEDVGLIIITTHGWSGITRWVLGSTADKILRATRRPVALIRVNAGSSVSDIREQGVFKTLLLPLDGSKEAEAAIPYAEKLALEVGSEAVLFQAITPMYFAYTIPGETVPIIHRPEEMQALETRAQEYLENIAASLREKNVKARPEVGIGTPAEEIIRISDELSAETIMSTHGRSGLSRWTFGSTSLKVLREGKTPLILVRTSPEDATTP